MKKIHLILIILVVSLILIFALGEEAKAGTGDNISGWAWSENIGWISFNSTNCDTDANGFIDVACGGDNTTTAVINYGVNIDLSTGNFSGYAWSANIGWIKFDPNTSTSPNPIGGPVRLDLGTNQVKGWARACAGAANADCTGGDNPVAGGWGGWISTRGETTEIPPNEYGVWLDTSISPNEFRGFAWGSDVVGWISFNCSNRGVCTTGTGEGGPSDYKVFIRVVPDFSISITPANDPPPADNGGTRINMGETQEYEVTVTSIDDFSGTVNLRAGIDNSAGTYANCNECLRACGADLPKCGTLSLSNILLSELDPFCGSYDGENCKLEYNPVVNFYDYYWCNKCDVNHNGIAGWGFFPPWDDLQVCGNTPAFCAPSGTGWLSFVSGSMNPRIQVNVSPGNPATETLYVPTSSFTPADTYTIYVTGVHDETYLAGGQERIAQAQLVVGTLPSPPSATPLPCREDTGNLADPLCYTLPCSDALHPRLSWNYSDDTPNGYHLTIYDGLGNLVYEYRVEGTASTSHTASYSAGTCQAGNGFKNSPVCNLEYGQTYNWQVEVKKSGGPWSNWSNTANFTTCLHAWPSPNFTCNVQDDCSIVSISAEEVVTLADSSTAYGGAIINQWLWTLPAEKTIVSGSTSSSPLQVKFSQGNDQPVTLRVTDSGGYSCETTEYLDVLAPLPQWREIAPTSWFLPKIFVKNLEKFLASVFQFLKAIV